MEAFASLLARLALTAVALLAVLLLFVVEPAMAPEGRAPKVLLLDRGRRARVGDRVLCTHEGERSIARVAATSGQRLALRGNLLFVDGEPVERRACRAEEAHAASEVPRGRCFVERRGDRSWVVAAPPEGRTVDLEVTVPAASLYLLADDRADHRSDSRGFGPVRREGCRTIAAEVSAGAIRYRP